MALALSVQPVFRSSNYASKHIKNKQKVGGGSGGGSGGAVGNVVEVVKKDFEFIKKGFSKGVEWANKTLHIPKIANSIDDFIWLPYVEDPLADSPPLLKTPSWPKPYYPGPSCYIFVFSNFVTSVTSS